MKQLNKKKKLLSLTLILFLGINVVGYLGAYQLTHYRQPEERGLGFPRPQQDRLPSDRNLKYATNRLKIGDRQWLEIWTIEPTVTSKGTVILFHGKDSTKSSSIDSAKAFQTLGYRALLVDFRGVGGSSGSSTTIGVREGQDVVLVTDYVRQNYPSQPVILYGISMGSAAILQAIAKQELHADKIILELPFTSLISAVRLRLKRSKIPTFPLAELFVFWGGVQHGFNGFAHNPLNYADRVNCPTLILYGGQDVTVDKTEIEELFARIPTPKRLVEFVDAKHELLINVQPQLWQKSVAEFLNL